MNIAMMASPPTAPPVIAPTGLDWATGAKATGCWEAAVVADEFPAVDVVVVVDIVVSSNPDAVTVDGEAGVVAKTELDLNVGLTVEIELAG